MRLHENVEDVAILIDSPPEILPLTLDRHKELVQVPGVAQATCSPPELACVLRTKFPRPLAHGLVGDGDSALCQQIFDVSQAQTKPVVEPDGVADDLCGESVSAIAPFLGFHAGSLPATTST